VEFTELNKAKENFKLGIRVYEPSEDGIWRLNRQPAHYEAVGVEPMTIGWYGGQAFLLTDIKKVTTLVLTAIRSSQKLSIYNATQFVVQK